MLPDANANANASANANANANASGDEGTEDGEVFVPENVEDWVAFFMANEKCQAETAQIRGMEVIFTMLERTRARQRRSIGQGKRKLFATVQMAEVWQLFRKMDVNRDGNITPKVGVLVCVGFFVLVCLCVCTYQSSSGG